MIKIHPEPPDMGIREACCFCRQKTIFWSGDNGDFEPNVAICPNCASVVEVTDLPSKEEWCKRERIIDRGRRRDMTRILLLNLLPAEIECPHLGCEKGALDTGGVTPQGSGIADKCPQCNGTGKVKTANCIDELYEHARP